MFVCERLKCGYLAIPHKSKSFAVDVAAEVFLFLQIRNPNEKQTQYIRKKNKNRIYKRKTIDKNI